MRAAVKPCAAILVSSDAVGLVHKNSNLEAQQTRYRSFQATCAEGPSRPNYTSRTPSWKALSRPAAVAVTGSLLAEGVERGAALDGSL